MDIRFLFSAYHILHNVEHVTIQRSICNGRGYLLNNHEVDEIFSYIFFCWANDAILLFGLCFDHRLVWVSPCFVKSDKATMIVLWILLKQLQTVLETFYRTSYLVNCEHSSIVLIAISCENIRNAFTWDEVLLTISCCSNLSSPE